MTLRYAHLSPRYLADEVKILDRFQQDGRPNGKSARRRLLMTRMKNPTGDEDEKQ
jgi:hypothetical protein